MSMIRNEMYILLIIYIYIMLTGVNILEEDFQIIKRKVSRNNKKYRMNKTQKVGVVKIFELY